MSLHVIVLLYPHGAQERGSTGSVYGLCCCRAGRAVGLSALLSGHCVLSGCRQLPGCLTLGPDSDGAPRLSDSAVRLSDTCCQTVGESAVSAVRLSGTVRRCPRFAVRLSDQGSVHSLLSQSHVVPRLESSERNRCTTTRQSRLKRSGPQGKSGGV